MAELNLTERRKSDNVKYYFELAKAWKPSVMIPEGALWYMYKAYTEAQKES